MRKHEFSVLNIFSALCQSGRGECSRESTSTSTLEEWRQLSGGREEGKGGGENRVRRDGVTEG